MDAKPVITERVSNTYFGHTIDGDWTKDHGILYSIAGQPFESLGHAIDFAKSNPKQSTTAATQISDGGPAIEPEKPREPQAETSAT